jgi:Ser/Thr protein kinase RdoA (MazF antagonist)
LRRFDLGDPVEPPVAVAEAWSNEVYRVHTRRGSYAVKLFPPNLSAVRRQILDRAVDFERRVLAAGLAVPTPVPSDDAELLADFPVSKGIRTARCHHWVNGTPASRLVGDDELAAAAGQMLGRLHALHVPGGDSSQLTEPDRERWGRAVASSEAANLPWAGELAALTPMVNELADRIRRLQRQRRPMRMSHRDFDPKNAIVDDLGRLVVADWDFAGPVLPGVELVVAGQSFVRSEEQLRPFAEAYRHAGGDAEPADDLALSVESADLDWLLRNVEAVALGRLGPTAAEFQTASELIRSFAADIGELESWSVKLRNYLA